MKIFERILVRKEVDYVMNAIKKYWPTAIHVIAIGAILLDPGMRQFLQANPKYGAVGLVVWGELMHWLQSPRNSQSA